MFLLHESCLQSINTILLQYAQYSILVKWKISFKTSILNYFSYIFSLKEKFLIMNKPDNRLVIQT